MSRISTWAWAVSLLVCGCGSRSNLSYVDGEAPSGSGGQGTSGTTGGGPAGGSGGVTMGSGGSGGITTGGSGGAAGLCEALFVHEPPAFLESGFGYHERRPTWTFSDDSGEQVTLVSSRQPTEGPGGGDFPTSIVHTTLAPWGTFPSGQPLGPTDLAEPEGGETFAAARAPQSQFGLLFSNTLSGGAGLRFSAGYQPFNSIQPNSTLLSPNAQEALFLSQGPDGHLGGMLLEGASGGGSSYLFQAAWIDKNGDTTGGVDLGCGSGPLLADAVHIGEKWLLAYSVGDLFGGDCLDPGLSWPDEVQLAVTDGVNYTLGDWIPAPGGATDVKAAKAKDGAWVVVGTPPGQVVNGMFVAARVTPDPAAPIIFAVVGGEPGGEIPRSGTLAVAGLGDQLAVAFVDDSGDKGPFLHVLIVNEDGIRVASEDIFPGTSFSGAPSLLASPDGQSLLLAWAETPDQGMGDGDKIRAVRIDCIPPP